jgi:hypothetical protein
MQMIIQAKYFVPSTNLANNAITHSRISKVVRVMRHVCELKILAKLAQNCEICKGSIPHKNLSHRNLTKHKITPKEMQNFSRISNFS